MPLIACPECKRDVSDKASACPHCGNPLSRAVTIEATGKGPKVVQLIGGVLMLAGIGGCVLGPGMLFHGIGLFLVGLVIYVIGAVSGWWRHG